MRSRLFLHGLLLLLSLVVPLFFYILSSLNVGDALYTMLFLHSPFIFWLLLLPLKKRFLDIDEIDLYAGISSKLMFLAVALPGMRAAFRYHPFQDIGWFYYWYMFVAGSGYAYTLPFEAYIIGIPYLIYGFATGSWKLLGQILPSLLIVSNLAVLSLYIILLYWKKGYRRGAAKIIFISGVIANIVSLPFISAMFISYSLIYLPYLFLNLYRVHSIFLKELETRFNTNTGG